MKRIKILGCIVFAILMVASFSACGESTVGEKTVGENEKISYALNSVVSYLDKEDSASVSNEEISNFLISSFQSKELALKSATVFFEDFGDLEKGKTEDYEIDDGVFPFAHIVLAQKVYTSKNSWEDDSYYGISKTGTFKYAFAATETNDTIHNYSLEFMCKIGIDANELVTVEFVSNAVIDNDKDFSFYSAIDIDCDYNKNETFDVKIKTIHDETDIYGTYSYEYTFASVSDGSLVEYIKNGVESSTAIGSNFSELLDDEDFKFEAWIQRYANGSHYEPSELTDNNCIKDETLAKTYYNKAVNTYGVNSTALSFENKIKSTFITDNSFNNVIKDFETSLGHDLVIELVIGSDYGEDNNNYNGKTQLVVVLQEDINTPIKSVNTDINDTLAWLLSRQLMVRTYNGQNYNNLNFGYDSSDYKVAIVGRTDLNFEQDSSLFDRTFYSLVGDVASIEVKFTYINANETCETNLTIVFVTNYQGE